MMLNYTKGEWKVIYNGNSVLSVASSVKQCICKLPTNDNRFYFRKGTEADANARLIAAAPDMYEALKAAMCIIDPGYIAITCKCEQAIAKAEGK